MTDKPNARPDDPNAARQERLREALRENLKRRKSQARGRNDQASAAPEQDVRDSNSPSPESAPVPNGPDEPT
jgi:hypothetical protein